LAVADDDGGELVDLGQHAAHQLAQGEREADGGAGGGERDQQEEIADGAAQLLAVDLGEHAAIERRAQQAVQVGHRAIIRRAAGQLARSSVTTRTTGGPPVEIEAACASASRPPCDAAHAWSASSVGNDTSEMA